MMVIEKDLLSDQKQTDAVARRLTIARINARQPNCKDVHCALPVR